MYLPSDSKATDLSDDDSELALIRRRKMAEIAARDKKLQEQRERQQKVDAERMKLLKRFLAPDADSYLRNLKSREPSVGSEVEEVLLYLIVYKELRQIITQIDIMYIERQVKGEEPTIRVQRDGETSDFGSYVRDAIRKSDGKADG